MAWRADIKNGKIVPVEITVKLLLVAMKKSETRKFLIDGFPRSLNNYEVCAHSCIPGAKTPHLGGHETVSPFLALSRRPWFPALPPGSVSACPLNLPNPIETHQHANGGRAG